MGEKIRGLRKRLGLSQEELAEKLGVSRQAVSKWETGSDIPAAAKLKEIADFFGVTVDSLLRDGTAPEPVAPAKPGKQEECPKLTHRKKAAVFFLAAAVMILVFLLCLILSGNAKSAADSSVIRLDGIGLSVIPAIILLAVGGILFFRKE